MEVKKSLILLVIFLFPAFLFACGNNEVEATIVLEVSRGEVVFWPEGGEVILDVQSNAEVTASSSQPWCDVDIRTPGKLRITTVKNDVVGRERQAEVTVNAKDLARVIKVKQLSQEVRFEVQEEGIYINDRQSVEFTLTVIANSPYSIDSPSWAEEMGVESVNVVTNSHRFKLQPLSQPDSKREGKLVVKLDGFTNPGAITVPVGQSNKKSVFTSASYNILVGTWQDRKELVYTIIDTHDFDIWGTQEGTNVHLTDITKKFENYKFIGTGRDGGEKGEYSAILYKTDRFEVLENGNFWYSNTPEKPSYGWDATNYRRICSWGRFLDKETFNHFYFFNSHFDHQGVVARNKSAKLLLSMIKTIVEPGYPVFASGDLNCGPDSEPIALLKADGLLRDSRDLVETPKGPLGTFNGLKPDVVSTGRIDYLFVSEGITVKEYAVIDDRPGGKCPSDHDPVRIVTEF